MKKVFWLVTLMVMVFTACQRSPAETAAPAATAAEAAAPTEAPPTESAAAPVSHAFETGSAALEIEVPLDGRLAQPIEIETEHGVRFSAEAGTLLRTLRGMFVTGPITIGIDDAGGFGAPPDDIVVDGVVRVYVLVQTASGPELLNVRFEPAGQLQLPQSVDDTGEWATYIPAERGGGYLQGPLPETAAVATSGVLAAPANSNVHPQQVMTIKGGNVGINSDFGDTRILHIRKLLPDERREEVRDLIDLIVGGGGGYPSFEDLLNLVSREVQAVNHGFNPGPNGQFTATIRIYDPPEEEKIAGIFPDGWELFDGEEEFPEGGEIFIRKVSPEPAHAITFDSNLQFWDVDTLEKLWEMPLGYQITRNPIMSSNEKSVFLATDDGKILSVRTESEDDELLAYVTGDPRPPYILPGNFEGIDAPPTFDECLKGIEPVDGIELKCAIIGVDGLLNILLDPIGEGLLATTKKGEVIAIDPDTLEQELIADGFPVDNFVVAQHGGYLLGSTGNEIVQVNLLTRRPSSLLLVPDAQIVILGGISNRSDRVAAAYTGGIYGDESEGANGIIDLTSDKVIHKFETSGQVTAFNWTTDDRYLVVAIPDRVVVIDPQLLKVLDSIASMQPREMLIIAEDVEGEALATLVYTGGNSIHRVDITEAGESHRSFDSGLAFYLQHNCILHVYSVRLGRLCCAVRLFH